VEFHLCADDSNKGFCTSDRLRELAQIHAATTRDRTCRIEIQVLTFVPYAMNLTSFKPYVNGDIPFKVIANAMPQGASTLK
jgi:hypothetical protein